MWFGVGYYLFPCAVILAGSTGASMVQPASSQLNVLDTLFERGLTEFHRLLNGSFALRGLLSNPSPALTLFVPTNEAIDRWRRLNSNTASITSDVLQNHIVPGSWSEDQLRQVAQRPSKVQRKLSSGFFNSPLWFHLDDSTKKDGRANVPVLRINGAQLLSNGNNQFSSRNSMSPSTPFIHLLDDVLAPTGSEVSAAAFLRDSSLHIHPQLQLQEVGRRIQELSNQVPEFQDSSTIYTFFLPVNQAFDLLRNPASFNVNVLRSHVIPNELVFIQSASNSSSDRNADRSFPVSGNVQLGFFNNGSSRQAYSFVAQKDNARLRPGKVYRNILKSNIPVSNGVIHIIDGLLLVEENSVKNKVDTVPELQGFRELIARLDNVDGSDNVFVEALSPQQDGSKSLTLFVPSNDAVARLPQEQKWRLRNDRAFLTRILNLHLISNTQYPLLTVDMVNGSSVATAQDRRITFHKTNSKDAQLNMPSVRVDGVESRIVQGDIACANGVIHVVDSVLGLPFLTVLQILQAEPNLSRTFRAIEHSKDLKAALSTSGNNVTIFAPSDQAWLNLDQGDLARMISHSHLMSKVIRRHVVHGRRLDGQALRREERFTTIPGDIQIKQAYSKNDRTTMEPPRIVLSWKGHSASIVTYDIPAVNGLIHVLDQVLFDQDFDITQASLSCSTSLCSLLFIPQIFVIAFFHLVRYIS